MGSIARFPVIMSASPDLLWALTRKTNAYLVKRNGLQLSSEPNNVANKHSFKFSGLANFEAVGVEETDGKRGITLSKGIKKNTQRAVVSQDYKKGMRHVAKSIKAQTEGKFYRKDLTKPALARWYKLWKAQNRSVEDEE